MEHETDLERAFAEGLRSGSARDAYYALVEHDNHVWSARDRVRERAKEAFVSADPESRLWLARAFLATLRRDRQYDPAFLQLARTALEHARTPADAHESHLRLDLLAEVARYCVDFELYGAASWLAWRRDRAIAEAVDLWRDQASEAVALVCLGAGAFAEASRSSLAALAFYERKRPRSEMPYEIVFRLLCVSAIGRIELGEDAATVYATSLESSMAPELYMGPPEPHVPRLARLLLARGAHDAARQYVTWLSARVPPEWWPLLELRAATGLSANDAS